MNSPFPKNKIALHIGIALTASALFIGCAGNSAKKTEQAEMQQAKPVETLSVEHKQDVVPMTDTAKQETIVSSTDESLVSNILESNIDESNPEQANPATPVIAYPEIDIADVSKPEKINFNFGFDKSELSDEDKEVVKQHAKYLLNNPEATLKIKGHTDHHGPKVYNEFLSKKRANAIAKILIEAGVAESQLEINAMANDEPLQNVVDTRKNRRVELNYVEMNMATNNQ